MPDAPFERLDAGALTCLVSRPPGDGPAPVLCFLHGYDEAAPMPIARALTRHGPLAPTAAAAARERFLVVAPQLPRAGDVWHRSADDVRHAVQAAVDRYGGDAARWLLTGFSFGGNGAFDLAAAQPGRWRAVWAVDPTRVPPTAIGDLPVWLSIGAIARWNAARFARTLGLEPAPREGAPPCDARRLRLDEGLDHVGAAASAYGDARIYDWLLAHAGTGA